MQTEHDERKAAHRESDQQDFARTDAVGEIADRRLRQAGYDGKNSEGKTEFDIADAELLLEEGKQHRQHENMKVADPTGRRDGDQGTQRRVHLRLMPGGSYIDHL